MGVHLTSHGTLIDPSTVDHGLLLGLADDDHPGHSWLAGRSGGQSMFGGTLAGNIYDITGSASSPDVGIVRVNSPVTFTYDSFSNTTPAQQFLMNWAPAVAVNASYIGGCLQTAAAFTITTGVFIPAIFSDTNSYSVAAAPGFSAITFINELSVVQNSGNFNLPSALVINVGLTHSRTSSGTSTTPGTTGLSFSPQTRATVSGAIMTKTDQTALRCSPTFSTVAGSTANLGTIRGVHIFNPTNALFQPASGVETATAVIGLDMNNITFGGNIVKAAVRSAQTASGTNAWLFLNNGNCHSDHGGGHIYFDDNAGIAYGGISNTSFDVWQTWNGAGNYFRTFFIANSDSLRWSNPGPDRFLFDSDGGSASGEYNFNCARFSLGAQTGANGNSIGQFPAPARATAVNGGWVDFSFSQAGNLTINHSMSDVSALNMAAISLTIGTGAITGYITTFNVGMTSSGVTGVETSAFRPSGRIHHRGVMETPPLTPGVLAVNTNNYSPATFNSMRQMWRVAASAAVNITGIAVPLSNNPADTQWLVNVGAFAITLTHQDALSTAGNRFISPSGANYLLGPDESVMLWHDPTTDRWRILWGTGA